MPTKPKKMKTIEEIRKMTPKRRSRYIGTLTHEQMMEITEPCSGEAHRPEVAGNIDYCMVCINTYWGRVLRWT